MPRDLRGLERFFDVIIRIFRPFNDVDFFAAELGGDDRDAYAALADECADRIDVLIVGMHGDLGAAARLAHDAFYFDDAEAISGTSASKSLVRKRGCERERRMNVPRTPSSTRRRSARTRSPWR
jgi:hypothetical protein